MLTEMISGVHKTPRAVNYLLFIAVYRDKYKHYLHRPFTLCQTGFCRFIFMNIKHHWFYSLGLFCKLKVIKKPLFTEAYNNKLMYFKMVYRHQNHQTP